VSKAGKKAPGRVEVPADLLLASFGAEGAIAMRLHDRVPRILNPAAAVAFEAIRAGGGPEGAAEALRSAYGIPAATARRDAEALLAGLAAEGLVGLDGKIPGPPPLPAGWDRDQEADMSEPKRDPAPAPGAGEPAKDAPPVPEGAVPRLTERDVILREEDEGSFLFEPETGDLSCLNPVGTVVWKLLDGKRTLGAIADAVAAEFEGVDRAAVLADVRAFLRDLEAFGYAAW
jgi:hypothetical protein